MLHVKCVIPISRNLIGSLLPGKNWARRDIWDTTSSMLGRTLIALSQHFVISVSTTGGHP